MKRRLRGAAVLICVLAAGALLRGTADAQHSTPALDAIAQIIASARDYVVTIDAHEFDGSRRDDRVLRFWFRNPDRAKMKVLRGKAAGIRLLWMGATNVRVRGGMFSLVPLVLDLHDPRITSLRGNTILRAEFEPALSCFMQDRDDVTEKPGPRLNGRATVVIALQRPSGLGCAADSSADRSVTRDELTVVRGTALLLRRERYAGSALVERWDLRDLRFNVGLSEADFH